MGRIEEQVRAFFKQEQWSVSDAQLEPGTFLVQYRGENGQWTCSAVAIEAHEQFLFFCHFPFRCAPERVAATSEFLHRANDGIHIGNFEFSISDGEIRYKASVSASDAPFEIESCRNVIFFACLMMDMYFPGLNGLLNLGLSVDDALALCEPEHNASAQKG